METSLRSHTTSLRPIQINAPDGRSAYLEIVDGVLVYGGDLPTTEAGQIFLRHLAEMVIVDGRCSAKS